MKHNKLYIETLEPTSYTYKKRIAELEEENKFLTEELLRMRKREETLNRILERVFPDGSLPSRERGLKYFK